MLTLFKAEQKSYFTPNTQRKDISSIILKENWHYNDYKLLTYQTGLTPISLDILKNSNRKNEILLVQNAYFSNIETVCKPYMMFSRTERLKNSSSSITALENGDILITPSSHIFGIRNGHCAIIVDAKKGITLEATFFGRNSDFGTVERWKKYAAVAVYRLKDTDAKTRSQIAQQAEKNLINKPYSLLAGITKNNDYTHCSHLVWSAFKTFGYDLNSNGGKIVTPADIAKSEHLELKQVYGLNFKEK